VIIEANVRVRDRCAANGNERFAGGRCVWIMRATTSLPVPFSPLIRTVESVAAILATSVRSSSTTALLPTNSGCAELI
jgi:hypothetical protein